MLLRFAVLIIYFIICLMSSEGMTIIKYHGSSNRGEKVLRSDVVRKIYFDPAPAVDLRRKRRTQTLNLTPISNAAKTTKSQAQIIEKAAEDELANFLMKNGLALSAVVSTVPNQRLEVTIKPELAEVTKESTPAFIVGKRQNSDVKVQIPGILRTSENQKDALSYDVVENLVMSIKKNSLLNVDFIVKDIKSKLDMVLEKNSPGMRGPNSATSKPKKQNLIKEMDKIMDSFLRTSQNNSSSESSSAESDLPLLPAPVMRSKPQGEERLRDDQEEDLEFDLEDDDAFSGREKLRFTLKEK